jgi:hypothetical protein
MAFRGGLAEEFAEQERIAAQWAAEAKTYFARHGHAQMPALSEEPYFAPLVAKLPARLMKQDPPPDWARKQMVETALKEAIAAHYRSCFGNAAGYWQCGSCLFYTD